MSHPAIAMPAPNLEVLPHYLDVYTAEYADPRKYVVDHGITGFALLSDFDRRKELNNTSVIHPNACPGSFEPVPYLAIAALTAAGLDQQQIFDAYDTGSDKRHLDMLGFVYRNLGFSGLRNDLPSTWPPAIDFVRNAYYRELLQPEQRLRLRVDDAHEKNIARKHVENIRNCDRQNFHRGAYDSMMALSEEWGVSPLTTLALSRNVEWYIRRTPLTADQRAHVPDLIKNIQKNGVPRQTKIRGAVFTFAPSIPLDDLEYDTLAMIGFGMNTSHMSEASPKFRQQELTPGQVLNSVVRNELGYDNKVSNIGLATMLVRDGHMRVAPNRVFQQYHLPSSPLHDAVLALIPSGMTDEDMMDVITEAAPQFSELRPAAFKAAKEDICRAANVTNVGAFNMYMLAMGIVDQQDLQDVDILEPRGNIPRLMRKLASKS